jgi:hypothetical protein
MGRPVLPEPAPHYKAYIDAVPENDVFLALDNQRRELVRFLEDIHSSKLHYAYAPGKWTVSQVLQHLIDSERVFAYRALRIARADQTPLPGFEQDDFAANAPVDHRNLVDLSEELLAVRASSTHLLKSFTEDCWSRVGTANGRPIDVLTIAFIIPGHVQHHINILRERYGV